MSTEYWVGDMVKLTTACEVKCAKCSKMIPVDEPQIHMEDDRILCAQCFNKLLHYCPPNSEIRIKSVIQKQTVTANKVVGCYIYRIL